MPTRPYIQNSENTLTKRRDPLKMLLFLAMAGSTLLFVFLFVLFYARRPASQWYNPALPFTFWISSVVLMVSSITLHEAGIAFRNERFRAFRIGLGLTFAQGLAFLCLQAAGWLKLHSYGILPSESHALRIIYISTGLHALHVLGALFFIGRHFFRAVINYNYIDAFVYSINPPNRYKLHLTSLYWHFLDVLWLCIFLFLVYQQPV